MAHVTNFPILRHFRGEQSAHVMRFRGGRTIASGRGLAFWFAPLDTGIAEVPLDDRDLAFLFHGTSADFQDVTVQGVITYRVKDADVLVGRVDFGLDLVTGDYLKEPVEQIGDLLTQLAQQIAFGWIAALPLAAALAEGTAPLRRELAAGLAAEQSVADMGLTIVTVRVSAIRPTAEMEKALQTPARERIQMDADEAVFERRATAVEKERAIAENELANRIELTRREEELVRGQGANERLRVAEEAEAERIRATAEAARDRMSAETTAESIRLVDGAKAEAEAALMAVYREVPREVLVGIAMREFAGKLDTIEHLNITPEMLTPLLGDFLQAATGRLER